jgi:hypothetical protein
MLVYKIQRPCDVDIRLLGTGKEGGNEDSKRGRGKKLSIVWFHSSKHHGYPAPAESQNIH